MVTFKELSALSDKYVYDPNHNLRYLALAKLICRYSPKDVLVLGCGRGVLEYALPAQINCVSFDIDPKSVAIAKEINLNIKNRVFSEGNLFDLPADYHNRFDLVVISEVIEHLTNDTLAINMVHRYLKPETGVFVLTVPNIHRFMNKVYPVFGTKPKFMSDEHLREYCPVEIRGLLAECGFNVELMKFVYFCFPKEHVVRRFIPVDSPLRDFFLKLVPSWGSYIITVSR